MWNGFHAVGGRRFVRLVDADGVGNRFLLGVGLDLLEVGRFRDMNRDDLQTLICILFVQLNQSLRGRATRASPGRPELEQDRFTLMIRQLEFWATWRGSDGAIFHSARLIACSRDDDGALPSQMHFPFESMRNRCGMVFTP